VSDTIKVFLLTLSGLLPIVDPLAGSPIFLALTGGYSPEMRRALSRRVAVDSFFLMIGSYLVGAHVLSFFGVSLPVVQLGGGLVVVAVGWTMLMQSNATGEPARKEIEPQDEFSQAFYPLTMPLTVGPGSISVAITLGANSTHRYGVHVWFILAALIAMALIGLSIFLCYGFADRLARMVGHTGTNVIVRLSSFLLVCIGVQIAWNGLSALLLSLHFHVR
jgi:multiple antibiotic resistance protein